MNYTYHTVYTKYPACLSFSSYLKIRPVVTFNSDEIRNKMKSKYLANPDYNYEKVNRASLACGPMVKWAIAQVSFSHD